MPRVYPCVRSDGRMAASSAAQLFELPEVQSFIDEMCAPKSFVSQLHSGALPRERFQAYILQDKFFLFEFSRAYAAVSGVPAHRRPFN